MLDPNYPVECHLDHLRRICVVFAQPNVIVHAAAERRPDTVEHNPEATHALNVAATNNICTLAGELSFRLFCGIFSIQFFRPSHTMRVVIHMQRNTRPLSCT